MSHKKLRTYLKAKRLASGLRQSELAALVGLSTDAISKYELGLRYPSTKLVLAAPIIFGASAADLFPEQYTAIEEHIGAVGAVLSKQFEKSKSKRASKVRTFLRQIPLRVQEL